MRELTFDLLENVKLTPNKFAGKCSATGEDVPAGKGFVFRGDGGWTTLGAAAVEELRRAEVVLVADEAEMDRADEAEKARARAEACAIVGKENGPFVLKSFLLERPIRFDDGGPGSFDPAQLLGRVDLAKFAGNLRRAAFLRSKAVRDAMEAR